VQAGPEVGDRFKECQVPGFERTSISGCYPYVYLTHRSVFEIRTELSRNSRGWKRSRTARPVLHTDMRLKSKPFFLPIFPEFTLGTPFQGRSSMSYAVRDSAKSWLLAKGTNCSRRELNRVVNCSSSLASTNSFRGLAAVFRAYRKYDNRMSHTACRKSWSVRTRKVTHPELGTH
jgi:hypothetical protein